MKTAKEKKLKGNPSKRVIKEEYSLSCSDPFCPDDLNDLAKSYWYKISPYLIKTKQLHTLSEDTFNELCDIYSRLKDINHAIDETNRSLLQIDDKWDNKTGTESQSFRESALSDIKRKYSKQFLEYSKQFHLTPESMKGYYNFDDDNKEKELI